MTSRETSVHRPSPSTSLQVAFCGGGSGGHIAPAIAIAEVLRQRTEFGVQFFVSRRLVDRRMLESAGHLQAEIITQPVDRSTPRLKYLWALVRSFFACRRHLRRSRPLVVVGTGGFASIPGVLAARWLRIPIVLLELNCVPGRATRRLAPFASVLLTGWPLKPHVLSDCRVCPVGVPIAPRWWQAWEHAANSARRQVPAGSPPRRQVLILGGSQGARRLNQLVRSALVRLPSVDAVDVVHQTGRNDTNDTNDASDADADAFKRPAHVSYQAVTFLDDVPARLANADIVICRCGAMTLAEVAAVGRPAILVPLSTSADNHQQANAAWFASQQSGDIIDERSPEATDALLAAITRLLSSSQQRDQMAASTRPLVDPQSAARAVEQILSTAGLTTQGDDDAETPVAHDAVTGRAVADRAGSRDDRSGTSPSTAERGCDSGG